MRNLLLSVAGSTREIFNINIFRLSVRDIPLDAAATSQAIDSAGVLFDKDSRKRQINPQLRQRGERRQEVSHSITSIFRVSHLTNRQSVLFIRRILCVREITSDIFGTARLRASLRGSASF